MDLCGKPFSAADYLEITKRFGTVFLVDVPKMGMDRKDLVSCFLFLGLWCGNVLADIFCI